MIAGLATRPLDLDDAAAVQVLVAAEELVDLGTVEMSVEDVLADWQRPSYDVAASTIGVLDGDRLVAYGDLSGPGTAYAAVLPTHQGRGIGTGLARWLQARARERGYATIGAQTPLGSAADRLMADLGYTARWTAWDLELPPGAAIDARPLPAGFALREAAVEDRHAVWRLVEDAFGEWSERERQSFGDFGARTWDRPGAQPWNLRLLVGPADDLVGVAHVHLTGDSGYVARLAVRPDHRGRGLAAPLLVDAFARAREHGAVRCTLATDSRSGARGLYERVGMVVTSTWVMRAIDLGPS